MDADLHIARGRTRSTCNRPMPEHGSHDWNKGDAKLWCPGTDGSNPQIPQDLKSKLAEGVKKHGKTL